MAGKPLHCYALEMLLMECLSAYAGAVENIQETRQVNLKSHISGVLYPSAGGVNLIVNPKRPQTPNALKPSTPPNP